MRSISIILSDHGGIKQEQRVGLRMAGLIMELLSEQELIEKSPKGRALLHWSDDKVGLHVTKIK